jgi:HK97 family phage prohead protease
MHRLTVPVEWKAAADTGSLTGYASTFGNVDLGGDVVVPGAFRQAVAAIKSGRTIPLLADHVASTDNVIGTIHDATETDAGLVIAAKLARTQRAQDMRSLLTDGHVNRLSIGYQTLDESFEDRDGKAVRLLREVELYEVSAVVFAMNPQAAVTSAKTGGWTPSDPDLDLALAEAEIELLRLLDGT